MVPNPRFVLLFAAWFTALYLFIEGGREPGITPFVVHWFVLQPAAAILNEFAASHPVVVDGQRLVSAELRLRVLPGCEGTETWALLLAAVFAAPLSWRRKVAGALMGTALVLALNLARIVLLFVSAGANRDVFNAIHGYIAPTLIIVAASAYYLALVAQTRPRPP